MISYTSLSISPSSAQTLTGFINVSKTLLLILPCQPPLNVELSEDTQAEDWGRKNTKREITLCKPNPVVCPPARLGCDDAMFV